LGRKQTQNSNAVGRTVPALAGDKELPTRRTFGNGSAAAALSR